MRGKKLARLLRKLRAMRRSCPKRDQLLMRVGAAKTDVGRAFGFVKINLPAAGQEVTRETFRFQLDKAKLKEAELRDGHYLLRTNLVAEDPAVLWDRYVQLTQIEAAFKCLKSDLGIRPIHLSPAQNVVETFGAPLLKTKHIPSSHMPNCEGSVRLTGSSVPTLRISHAGSHVESMLD